MAGYEKFERKVQALCGARVVVLTGLSRTELIDAYREAIVIVDAELTGVCRLGFFFFFVLTSGCDSEFGFDIRTAPGRWRMNVASPNRLVFLELTPLSHCCFRGRCRTGADALGKRSLRCGAINRCR